jgi:hypothetical protein
LARCSRAWNGGAFACKAAQYGRRGRLPLRSACCNGCHAPFILQTVEEAHEELHLVCDNYATHKHSKVIEWLDKHSRLLVHFTPTSTSWLNMVECFFRDITIEQLRRGVFRGGPEPIPNPFIWTAKGNDILQKVVRATRRPGSKKNEAQH